MSETKESERFASRIPLAPGEKTQVLGWEFVVVLNAGTVVAVFKISKDGWHLHWWQPRTLSRWVRAMLDAGESPDPAPFEER